jgi:hypothetical protein
MKKQLPTTVMGEDQPGEGPGAVNPAEEEKVEEEGADGMIIRYG